MNRLLKSDYLRIKWPIIALIACITVALGVYAALSALDDSATQNLNMARAQLDNAQSRVDLIEQEESTIREYVGRYQDISAAGMVGQEDRLHLLERFATLREDHSLFPIDIQIAEQRRLPLQYGELSGRAVSGSGRPIALMVSSVNFSLPLLHENDLNRLLAGLLDASTLLQARSCNITANASSSYVRLGQHFNAACALSWYTFTITDTAAAPEDRQ